MNDDSPEKLSDLVRALNLIPYFQSHPGRTLFEAARDLGREPQELMGDLARLHCTGVGARPEELIDLTYSYTNVQIREDQGVGRVLRLTPTEAGTLLLTLEALEATPGLIDASAVESAAAKLRAIMDDKAAAVYDTISEVDPEESAVQQIVAEALQRRRRLRLTYFSASSNISTTRVVDPAKVIVRDGEPYVIAWEHGSGHRTFRLDRMTGVELLDDAADPHSEELGGKEGFGFTHTAELLIRADATWLAEYHDITLGQDRGDGWVQAVMPYGSRQWLRRFAIAQGDRLTVVRPSSLAQEVAERAEAGLRGYDEPTRSGRIALNTEER